MEVEIEDDMIGVDMVDIIIGCILRFTTTII